VTDIDIDKLFERLKEHAEAWEVKETDNRNELINERVMAFDCLTALEEIQRLRAIEAAAREYYDTTRFGTFLASHDAWMKLEAALAAKETP
jgi:hypothetical protein